MLEGDGVRAEVGGHKGQAAFLEPEKAKEDLRKTLHYHIFLCLLGRPR